MCLHTGVLALVASLPALAWHGWLIGAATIALAGAFQFSTLKYRCLEKCRTPQSFAVERWRGHAQRWNAFALGMRHSLSASDAAGR